MQLEHKGFIVTCPLCCNYMLLIQHKMKTIIILGWGYNYVVITT